MSPAFAEAVSQHAAGALAAQKAVDAIRTTPDADGFLMAAVLAASPDWRTSHEWLRGFLRVVEKAVR